VLKTVPTASTANDISKALSAAGIALMASSPPQNNAIKFFFYGQEVRFRQKLREARERAIKAPEASRTKGAGEGGAVWVSKAARSQLSPLNMAAPLLNRPIRAPTI
jgi:hypothetical protein